MGIHTYRKVGMEEGCWLLFKENDQGQSLCEKGTLEETTKTPRRGQADCHDPRQSHSYQKSARLQHLVCEQCMLFHVQVRERKAAQKGTIFKDSVPLVEDVSELLGNAFGCLV